MNVQVIKKDGRPEWAVIPYGDYERLLEEAEMAKDVRDYDEANRALDAGEELVPSEVTYAILDGQNPVRAWREHRGLTQQQLANAAALSVADLAEIEVGGRLATKAELEAIAHALRLAPDDLVAS